MLLVSSAASHSPLPLGVPDGLISIFVKESCWEYFSTNLPLLEWKDLECDFHMIVYFLPIIGVTNSSRNLSRIGNYGHYELPKKHVPI
jgi:hypothetical protein